MTSERTKSADKEQKNKTDNFYELSVVIPCLNEAETLEICINQVQKAFKEHNINGELIISDNGSTDGSQEIAMSKGVRVVHAKHKGYGSALMTGIENSKSKYIIMGDADASYDFGDIPRFLDKLNKGYDLVMGCRLPSGGGKILPGAMPFLHRWIGNPLFSFLIRLWFKAPIHDVHCGIRGFSKDLYNTLDLQCSGMEFASEMIIKASYFSDKIGEIPVTLHPDKRILQKRHLRTFRDGWRHLRFYLMYSPRWLFLIPGIILMLVGIFGYTTVMFHLQFFGRTYDVHSLLYSSFFTLCGYQSVLFAILAKTYAISEGLRPPDKNMKKFWGILNLEKGLLLGLITMAGGILLLSMTVVKWKNLGFGMLDTSQTMRFAIPGVMLAMIGFQTTLFSFFASILGLQRRQLTNIKTYE